jgi:galactokinase
LKQIVFDAFIAQFGYAPTIVVRSPGRVNLMGEHCDYNGGMVLPSAIEQSIYCAFGKFSGRTLRLAAHDLGKTYQTEIHTIARSEEQWVNYPLGVVHTLLQEGHQLSGCDILYGGDLPIGAGVSSSAALENGIGFGLNELFQLGLTKLELIQISLKAENNFVGVPCGIMDMFASMMGKANHLMLLNCRDLSFEYIPFPTEQYQIVLCNTMKKHVLTDGSFAQRAHECKAALAFLKTVAPSVADLTAPDWQLLAEAEQRGMPPTLLRRAQYIRSDRDRMSLIAQYFKDFSSENKETENGTLKQVMFESHQSLQKQYEVSCPELDFLVETAQSLPTCNGARMSGGGFGGCTIHLVEPRSVGSFTEYMKTQYAAHFNIEMEVIPVQLANGTESI